MAVSRRTFMAGLSGVGALTAARPLAQGLERFAASAPPCTDDPRVTPALPPNGTYRPGAPLRSRLAQGMRGTPLVFTGTVTGVACGRIAGARVDLWHADDRGYSDQAGVGLRGHQLTGKDGAFRFETIIPGTPAGRARHLGLRVEVKGKAELLTELFFPDDPAAPKDPRYRKELVVTFVQAPAGQKSATFDIWLPI
jgi:protocatechuate 3,4-dioxygenase beta subunit